MLRVMEMLVLGLLVFGSLGVVGLMRTKNWAPCFLAIPPSYQTVPKDEKVNFLFVSSTERRNQSIGVRPGQRRGSRGRGVLCRVHLSNSKTLPTRSWKGTHSETVRETDRDISQKRFGFTGSRGKLKPATQGNYIRRSLRI